MFQVKGVVCPPRRRGITGPGRWGGPRHYRQVCRRVSGHAQELECV